MSVSWWLGHLQIWSLCQMLPLHQRSLPGSQATCNCWWFKADLNGPLFLHHCSVLIAISLFIIRHFHSARHRLSTSEVCCSCHRVPRELLLRVKGSKCIPHRGRFNQGSTRKHAEINGISLDSTTRKKWHSQPKMSTSQKWIAVELRSWLKLV